MDAITFKNKCGENYGIADGVAYLTKAGVKLGGNISADALERAGAEGYRCEELHEAKLHEDPGRSVTLVKKNGVRSTDVSTLRVETNDEANQRAFAAAVVRNMRPTREDRTSTVWSDLVGPLIFGILVAIIGGVVVSMAASIAGGTYQPSDRVGKARAIARLSEAVARTLGTTGSIVVFAILFLLCVAWAVAVVRGRHMVTRWRVT